LLQIKLRIGYGKAVVILDTLEDTGIVEPYNVSKSGDVLKKD